MFCKNKLWICKGEKKRKRLIYNFFFLKKI